MENNKKYKLAVKHIIFHDINKKQFKPAELSISENEFSLEETKQVGDKFLNTFTENFSNPRKTNRSFGQFKGCTRSYPVPYLINEFLQGKTTFLEISKEMANRFYDTINDIPLATGGYIFCIDYYQNGTHMFAIVLLQLKDGFQIDVDNMSLEYANKLLEMDKMNMAVRIDIDLWLKEKSYLDDSKNDEELEQLEKNNYLSFIAGKKNLTNYFYSFVGSKKAENKTKATNFVKDTIIEFYKFKYENDKNYDPQNTDLKKLMYTTFDMGKKSLEGINITNIIATIFIDEDLQTEYFKRYEEQYVEKKIPNQFIPDKRVYSQLVQVRYIKKGIDLKMDKTWMNNNTEYCETGLLIKDPDICKELKELE